ncbi:hypothetical protein [Bifidobacterium myosotis]|uniref:Uncharacterized protein n=1 Tax=Bifidobacterium myosotis TaxID=1630166 RepID=A0A5M9ZHZ2_9BIFI|nr:hypothetical protein [Bifidobacterium myosotis]KAA8827206.1 hypothetical protein EMO91_09135 [Bifidobacterium myosotis]
MSLKSIIRKWLGIYDMHTGPQGMAGESVSVIINDPTTGEWKWIGSYGVEHSIMTPEEWAAQQKRKS